MPNSQHYLYSLTKIYHFYNYEVICIFTSFPNMIVAFGLQHLKWYNKISLNISNDILIRSRKKIDTILMMKKYTGVTQHFIAYIQDQSSTRLSYFICNSIKVSSSRISSDILPLYPHTFIAITTKIYIYIYGIAYKIFCGIQDKR